MGWQQHIQAHHAGVIVKHIPFDTAHRWISRLAEMSYPIMIEQIPLLAAEFGWESTNRPGAYFSTTGRMPHTFGCPMTGRATRSCSSPLPWFRIELKPWMQKLRSPTVIRITSLPRLRPGGRPVLGAAVRRRSHGNSDPGHTSTWAFATPRSSCPSSGSPPEPLQTCGALRVETFREATRRTFAALGHIDPLVRPGKLGRCSRPHFRCSHRSRSLRRVRVETSGDGSSERPPGLDCRALGALGSTSGCRDPRYRVLGPSPKSRHGPYSQAPGPARPAEKGVVNNTLRFLCLPI